LEKTRVLFLINSLNPGGAERQLCELVGRLDPERFEAHVAVYYDPPTPALASLFNQVAALPGVTLTSLRKRRGPLGYLVALPRLAGLIRRMDAQVLHGYMEGNLPMLFLGGLLRKRVVWGIRRTSSDHTKMDRLSLALLRFSIRLSPFVDLIIFNSEAGLLNHAAMGMRSPRMEVIPNGFNVDLFKPDPALGLARREAWGVPEDVPLIGIVGRLDPVKDHPTFLRAAARLSVDFPTARFICIGSGPAAYEARLKALAEELGIAGRVLWPGTSQDMHGAYNALSLLILASTDEGFPNVLGEAMACGVPCVTTRVGDAALLVGEIGRVVEPGDDEAMAGAAEQLLLEEGPKHDERMAAGRKRICETFSSEALARNTGELLNSLV
jgi:glycosyltransferase involved in cell wall biosynthesis